MRIIIVTLTVTATSLSTLHAETPSITHPHHVHGRSHALHLHDVETERTFATSVSFGYDSRYVLEGRDILDGDPILHGTVELSYRDLLFTAWLAESPASSYNEMNFVIEYGFELGAIDGYLSYNHLRFPDDDSHDHEVGVGFSYDDLPWALNAAVDAYYSIRNEGAFIETSLSREFAPCTWLTLQPAIVFGWNEAFVTSGHRGANHLAASLSAIIPLGKYAELSTYLSYNWAIQSDPLRSPDDQNLRDFLYGGIATTFTF